MYDFVGRVFLDVVDLTQWKMGLIFHTAMKEESNVRQYKWDYQSLPVGRRSRVHRPVRDRDDSADDEDLSEAAVTFAREQVEMKETPKPQYGEVDTFEGTWISVEFYSMDTALEGEILELGNYKLYQGRSPGTAWRYKGCIRGPLFRNR